MFYNPTLWCYSGTGKHAGPSSRRFGVQAPVASPANAEVAQRKEANALGALQCGFESHPQYHICANDGMVDVAASKAAASDGVWVRVPLCAPKTHTAIF